MKTTPIAIGITVTLMLGTALPALALDVNLGASADASASASAGGAAPTVTTTTTGGTKVSAKIAARIAKGQERAKKEIARRTAALGDLGDKVSAMARVSADVKGSISATVQAQVTALQALQGKIDADTDIDTLKADVKSITDSYRIFMLVLPQGHITTASDSIQIAAASLSTLSDKLATRVTDAQAKGSDVSMMNKTLVDMKAKLADANTQASAAVSATASLKPDNGDKTIMAANKAAIKDAQSKLKAGRADLAAARKDAGDIVKALKTLNASATTTTTVSASTTTQ